MGWIAPFVPSIIQGVGTVFGAHEAASGQEKAAETQAKASAAATEAQLEAAREALAFQKQKYNANQEAVNPYQNYGLGALAALGTGLGVTPGNLKAATVPVGSTDTGLGLGTMLPGIAKSGVLSPAQLDIVRSSVGLPPTTAPSVAAMVTGQGQPANAMTASSVQPAQIGETRMIQGQQARWDGKGWEAV